MLGSNRGDRQACLRAALAALPAAGVAVTCVSRWRETPPFGATGRRFFLNCAVAGDTHLLPRLLLRRLLQLESRLGRHRPGRSRLKSPRTVDLDLIFYARVQMQTPQLQLPHPRFAQRGFVLTALADLIAQAPEARAYLPAAWRAINTLRARASSVAACGSRLTAFSTSGSTSISVS